MEYLIGFAIGMLVTIVIQRVRATAGTITIDTSAEDKDMYHLSVDNLDTLNRKKYVIFRITRK